jgi:hypothetical protein
MSESINGARASMEREMKATGDNIQQRDQAPEFGVEVWGSNFRIPRTPVGTIFSIHMSSEDWKLKSDMWFAS